MNQTQVVRVVGGRYGHLARVLADAEVGKEVGSILFDFTIPMMERAVLALTPATASTRGREHVCSYWARMRGGMCPVDCVRAWSFLRMQFWC